MLRSKEKEHIHTFPWEALYEEFCSHCPTLVNLLASATDSQSGSRNREKIVTMIVCILAKFRCSKLALFQKMISAVLFSAHVGTSVGNTECNSDVIIWLTIQVYNRLQKLMLSVSRNATFVLINQFGEGYDYEVLKWRESLLPFCVTPNKDVSLQVCVPQKHW